MKRIGSLRAMRNVVLGIGLLVCLGADAGPLTWFSRTPLWPWGWPDTLIVTGNYVEARLLGEVAQLRTRQPLLLISAEAGGDRIFYLPHKKAEVLELTEAQYVEFIESMLRPKKIVFLGGEEMIPTRYVDAVRSNYTSIVIKGDDWERNAKQLGKIMRRSLARSYRKARKQLLESKAHREAYDPAGETIQMPTIE